MSAEAKPADRRCITPGCSHWSKTGRFSFCLGCFHPANAAALLTIRRDLDGTGDGDVSCPWCGRRAPLNGLRILRHHHGEGLCSGSGRTLETTECRAHLASAPANEGST